jgi:PAS domain S-box-containing protein
MHWQHTPYVLPLLATAAISVAQAVYAWRRRSMPGATAFAALMLAVLLWALAYALELAGADLPTKRTGAQVAYLGTALLPPLWLLFASLYGGPKKQLSLRLLVLLAIEPVFTSLLIATNDGHHLVWTHIELVAAGPFVGLGVRHGLWLWLHSMYASGVLALGVGILIRTLLRSRHLDMSHAGTALLGVLTPWLGMVLYLVSLQPLPRLGWTPVAIPVTTLALAWAVFRFRLLDIAPVVRDAILEGMSEGVVVLDAQNRVVDINSAAQSVIGIPAHAVTGHPAMQVLGIFTPVLASQPEGIRSKVELVVGEGPLARDYEVTISPLYHRRGDLAGRLVVLRDVTERKRAEEALRQSEEQYRALIEMAPDIIYLIAQDGSFIALNPAFQRLTGWSPAEWLGKPFMSLVHPDDLRMAVQQHLQVLRGQTPPAYELRLRTRRGEYLVMEFRSTPRIENGRVIGAFGIARDVTERKRMEEALRASEERYRNLIENAKDMIYTHDLHGRFTSINAAGEQITGYTRAEILHMTIADLVAPEHRDALYRLPTPRESSGAPTVMSLEIQTKDGRRVALEVSSRLIYEGDAPVGVEGIARDVTERRELEAQLRQAQKMEAIGRLAGGVAHDFNNLLTAINGWGEILLQELPPDDYRRQFAEEITRAGQRAAELTRQLLAFGRRQVLAPKVLDLNATITSMQKMLRRLIGENIQLVTELDPNLGHVKADPGQLEQVIMNLCVNARDAMPSGGTLTIATANVVVVEHRWQPGQPSELKPGAYVMLAISDTGIGMDAATQARIFEPFFTTKERGKGTGLGLATVYGIITQSGGHITVHSQPGRGTTFRIYLPQVAPAPEHPEVPAVADSLPRGTETILLVEDEDGVRSLARSALQRQGYSVIEACDGTDALARYMHHAGRVDLLLTDVVMPRMGGPDLAQRIQVLQPDIRVLYMSGYTDSSLVHAGVAAESVAFLQKPFTPDALARKVREVLDRPAGQTGSAAAQAAIRAAVRPALPWEPHEGVPRG